VIEVRLGFTTALVAVLVTTAAYAQPPASANPQEEARQQYERGTVAYNLERFDEAIAAFSRAYELDPAPTLLFNIAQARWKKGENERAVFYYRRYLDADPAAPNRAQVEARIRELQARPQPNAVAQAPAVAPVAVAPAPPLFVQAAPAPAREPLYRRAWFWGAVAGGAAAIVVTAVLISSSSKSASPRCTTDCNLGMVTVP
jgi:tetratricopeptide (TPR) repeat protein